MIRGRLTLDNVKGFMAVTYDDVTELRLNDSETVVISYLTKEVATDIANALLRSVNLPRERVTGKEMREMRAKKGETLDDEAEDK